MVGAPGPGGHNTGIKMLNAVNEDGNVIFAGGNTVPTDTGAGYATGCLFLHFDGGDGTALYVNEGTATSCDFNAITVA